MEGMKNRMEQTWIPNKDFSIELLSEILMSLERKIGGSADDLIEKHKWVVFNSYAAMVYVVSLRGPEGLLIDLDGLNRHWPPRSD